MLQRPQLQVSRLLSLRLSGRASLDAPVSPGFKEALSRPPPFPHPGKVVDVQFVQLSVVVRTGTVASELVA